MVRSDDIRGRITTLIGSGWTLAAIADELDIHYSTLARWRAGQRHPENAKPVLMALDSLADKMPPKKRRYGPDGHYLQRRARGETDDANQPQA